MFNPFKKRPGVTLVIAIAAFYVCVIGGWAGFIIMAKSTKTAKLTHEEAVQFHKDCVAHKAAEEKQKLPQQRPQQ